MSVYKIGIVLFSLGFLSLFMACEKDPEIIEKVVTIRDTIIIIKTDTITINKYFKDSATTFILSRHTETTGMGSDPSLSIAGQERATELARMLNTAKIQAVYSTNFNRTKETAAKVASINALTTQIYDASKLDALATTILNQYKNGVVYISGHSNTTNVLLNTLIGAQVYGIIPDSEYDNLYIVNVLTKGNAKVVHLKYGK